MKLTKILGISFAVLSLTACDKNNVEDYPNFLGAVNTEAGVTVSLEPTLDAQENQPFIMVPVKVTGKTNGKVVVTIEVKEGVGGTDLDPAKEVKNYNVTSKTINIPEGETEGYVEIVPVWEVGLVNNDCVFDVSIVKVEGATAVPGDCIVTIANVDSEYTQMLGRWTMTAIDATGETVSWRINLKAPSFDDEEFGSVLNAYGVFDEQDLFLPFTDFEYNEETETATMKLGLGRPMAAGTLNFTNIGECWVKCLVSTSTGLAMSGNVLLKIDKDMKQITFPEGLTIVAGVFIAETNQYVGAWQRFSSPQMSR